MTQTKPRPRSSRMEKASSVAQGQVTNETGRPRPQQLDRLETFIGRWITEGQTATSGDGPSIPIVASDVYSWMPGRRFVMHEAYGRFGDFDVGGLEIIGYDPATGQFSTHFFDSRGVVTTQELSYTDGVWAWRGVHERCFGKLTDDGRSVTAQHERSEDGKRWEPSMTVTLRKVE